jgi:hypothetical protein
MPIILPSFSPKPGGEFDGTFLSLALFLPLCIYFLKGKPAPAFPGLSRVIVLPATFARPAQIFERQDARARRRRLRRLF